MTNNKCFYVHCKQGFVAFVWADSSIQAKRFAWFKRLGVCNEFCHDYDSLGVLRCRTLDSKYTNYVEYADILGAPISDNFIDVSSDAGIKFLIMYCSSLISSSDDSNVMVIHHSPKAKTDYELKVIKEWH